MKIASGVTDQYIYFVAVDSTDLKTRETGLSTFTVYRDRNGGGISVMTTPTVAEVSAVNMPGVYTLLLDEDMTIATGNETEEMVFHITHAGMAPVTRTIELYRPKITAGNTLTVSAGGAVSSVTLCDTVTTLTGHTAQTGDTYALANGANGFANIKTDTADALTRLPAALISGRMAADVEAIGDDTQSLADLKDFADAGYDPVTHKVAGVVLTDTVTTLTGHTAQTGDTYALANGANGFANIKTDTADALTRLPAALISGRMAADVEAIGDDTQSLADLKDFADAGYNPVTHKIAGVVLCDTCTTNTDMITEPPSVVAIRTEIDSNSTQLASIASRLPAALVSGRMSSDAAAISGSTDAADKLEASAEMMVLGTVDTVTNGHTPTTTEFQADDITELTPDHYNGRIVIFLTGELAYQAAEITDYVSVGGIGQFTTSALTSAPENDDTFIII